MTQRMRTTLDLPTVLPEWATDAGAIVEPDLTDKRTGWVAGTKPPARWMNWVLNALTGFAQTAASAIIGTWSEHDPTASFVDKISFTHYHPALGLWVGYNGVDDSHYYSEDGFKYIDSGNSDEGGSIYVSGKDSSRLIISSLGVTTGGLIYTTDGINYNAQPSGPTAYTPYGLDTKYPDSDFCVTVGSGVTNALIGIAPNVITAWVAPTGTFPTIPNADLATDSLRWLHGTTWILLTKPGNTYVSTDDCDNWAVTAEVPEDVTSAAISTYSCIGYNPDSNRVIVGGFDGTSTYSLQPEIVYSDDAGTSWTPAALATSILSDAPMTVGTDYWRCSFVYYCGGGMWIFGGERKDREATSTPWLSASFDDGETWVPINLPFTEGIGGIEPLHPSCDGRHLVLTMDRTASNHTLIHSNSMAATARQ
ncbi:MAG: hypothetical protein JRC86_10330 [Deltaproteobacteria bacterium]|nr:hypothetical protein [Deltaproteobacteria bacterium]